MKTLLIIIIVLFTGCQFVRDVNDLNRAFHPNGIHGGFGKVNP
jgi:hypothetical protein